jgi:uncharacterized protein (TIGR02118 family)
MIKVSMLYANSAGCTFDMNYYLDRHVPMVEEKFGRACENVEVDQGVGSSAPGAPAPFVAIGHFYFQSVEAFHAAFAPHAQAIMADIPNYTNAQPIIQVSEVRM